MDALQVIRDRIRTADLPLLDRPVFTDTQLITVLRAVETENSRLGPHVDVPIRAIVGLSHAHPKDEGKSWRHVVNHVLHGDHGQWDERVLAYFESEIGDQWFPAPNSRERLELRCVGGAVFCTTGNHRLPAGIAWLAATQGENARFRKVWTTFSSVNRRLIESLQRWRQEGRRLSVDWCAGGYHVFRTERDGEVETFIFTDGKMKAKFAEEHRLFDRRKPFGDHFSWIEIPDTLLDAWTTEQWWPEGMQEFVTGAA